MINQPSISDKQFPVVNRCPQPIHVHNFLGTASSPSPLPTRPKLKSDWTSLLGFGMACVHIFKIQQPQSHSISLPLRPQYNLSLQRSIQYHTVIWYPINIYTRPSANHYSCASPAAARQTPLLPKPYCSWALSALHDETPDARRGLRLDFSHYPRVINGYSTRLRWFTYRELLFCQCLLLVTMAIDYN